MSAGGKVNLKFVIKVKNFWEILSFFSHTPVKQGHTSYSVKDVSAEKKATNFMFTGGNLR